MGLKMHLVEIHNTTKKWKKIYMNEVPSERLPTITYGFHSDELSYCSVEELWSVSKKNVVNSLDNLLFFFGKFKITKREGKFLFRVLMKEAELDSLITRKPMRTTVRSTVFPEERRGEEPIIIIIEMIFRTPEAHEVYLYNNNCRTYEHQCCPFPPDEEMVSDEDSEEYDEDDYEDEEGDYDEEDEGDYEEETVESGGPDDFQDLDDENAQTPSSTASLPSSPGSATTPSSTTPSSAEKVHELQPTSIRTMSTSAPARQEEAPARQEEELLRPAVMRDEDDDVQEQIVIIDDDEHPLQDQEGHTPQPPESPIASTSTAAQAGSSGANESVRRSARPRKTPRKWEDGVLDCSRIISKPSSSKAPSTSSPATPKRTWTCKKCAVHGVTAPFAGHTNCPWLTCKCPPCEEIDTLRQSKNDSRKRNNKKKGF